MKELTSEEFCNVLREWKGQDLFVSFFSKDKDIHQLPCQVGDIGLANFSVKSGGNLAMFFRYDSAKLSFSEDGCSLRVGYINSMDNLLLEKSYPRGE
jgi:hypothetical protein